MMIDDGEAPTQRAAVGDDGDDDLMSGAFGIAVHQSRFMYSSYTDPGESVRDDDGAMALDNMATISVDWTDDALANVRVPEAEEMAELHPTCSGGESGELTLEKCLAHFTAPEVLSEQDTWYCSKCKEHVRARKTMALWSVPRLLVVHLKRFSEEEGYGGR